MLTQANNKTSVLEEWEEWDKASTNQEWVNKCFMKDNKCYTEVKDLAIINHQA